MNVVIVGSGAVGKTSLLNVWSGMDFDTEYNPTVQSSQTIEADGMELEVIDTSGQEEYRTVRDNMIRSGNAFIVVYSVISRSSFDEARALHTHIKRSKNFAIVPTVTVANKTDLKDDAIVNSEEGHTLAEEFRSVFLETSAKKGTGVEEIFPTLVREIRRIRKIQDRQQAPERSCVGKCEIF